MINWLKIQDENGDTYLVNMDNIVYISKNGIATKGCRGYEHLTIPLDVEYVERAIIATRKTGERWLHGKID